MVSEEVTHMDLVRRVTVAAVVFAAQSTLAADADNGRRLAQQHCSPCHNVEPNQRRELANSLPFEMIAQKYGNAPEAIAFAILAPHPRMNVTLSRREAQDIAAYIATFAK
jgi:mono/diheme cytochrome c family protein